MKIKTKKQLNLPQLLEWAWDNGKRNLSFRGYDKEGSVVYISINENGEFTSDWRISKDQIFTVEVEEEITEDTEIFKLAHYSIYGFKGTKNCTSINDVKDDNSIAFYIMNNDRTMTLIWTKDKGLVE